MSSLAGWAAPTEAGDESPEIFLKKMLSGSDGSPSGIQGIRKARGVSGVARRAMPASVFANERFQVAVIGNIHWRDTELARIARESSDATAIASGIDDNRKLPLARMNGSFALAVIDNESGTTQLAIDPMGIERLCYTVFDGQLLFATSTQALRRHPDFKAGISSQAIYHYLYHHCIPAPLTIYENVFKLEAGELLTFHGGRADKSRYWQLHFEDDVVQSLDDLVGRFQQVLRTSMQRPVERFDDIGAFLSGGLDSSCVTAALTEVSGKARTFAIGFNAEGYDESAFAQITADRFHAEHHHYYVTPRDVCEALPRVAAFYDEPFGNASAVPAYLCARLAHEAGIRNLLAGDGGDEIFGGNERYVKQQVFGYWQRIPAPLRAHLLEPLLNYLPLGDHIGLLRKARSYVEQANIPLPDRFETYNFLHRESPDAMFCVDFLKSVDTTAPLAAQRGVYRAADTTAELNRMLFLDMKYTLADNDIRKVNAMCDLAGINVHYPLIDLDMVEFAARVPARLKIRGRQLRWFFKHAMKDILAPETLNKSKHGFGLPFGVWMSNEPELHAMARDSLQAFGARGYMQPDYIDSLWRRHREEHSAYFGTMIWVCMALEQWLQAHS